ncbi:unnamed protein product [Caenorhabditis sp. 36 PRJEB53466]|nr:unnamed protein product [Caenorhabditis sp. 36 PRJEB53466]
MEAELSRRTRNGWTANHSDENLLDIMDRRNQILLLKHNAMSGPQGAERWPKVATGWQPRTGQWSRGQPKKLRFDEEQDALKTYIDSESIC